MDLLHKDNICQLNSAFLYLPSVPNSPTMIILYGKVEISNHLGLYSLKRYAKVNYIHNKGFRVLTNTFFTNTTNSTPKMQSYFIFNNQI